MNKSFCSNNSVGLQSVSAGGSCITFTHVLGSGLWTLSLKITWDPAPARKWIPSRFHPTFHWNMNSNCTSTARGVHLSIRSVLGCFSDRTEITEFQVYRTEPTELHCRTEPISNQNFWFGFMGFNYSNL